MTKSKENIPKPKPELQVSELEKLRFRLSKLKPTKGNLTRLCRECAELDDGDVKNEIIRRIFFSDTFPGDSPELRASIFFDAGNESLPDEILASAGFGTALAATDAVLDTLPRNDEEKKGTLPSSVLSRKDFCTKAFRRAVVSAESNENAEYLQRRLSRTMGNLLATRGNIDASRFNAEFRESLLRIASSAGSPALLSLALLFVPEGTGRTSILERLEKTPRDAELARSVANALRFDGEIFALSKQERRTLVDITKSCTSIPVFSTLESACRDGEDDGYLLSSLAGLVDDGRLEYGWTDLWKLVEAMAGSTSSEETEPAFLEAAGKLVASFSTRRKHSTRSSTGGINIESVAKALSEWKNESARNAIFEAVFEKTKDGEHAIYTDVDERCLLAAAFLSGECEIGAEEKEIEISDQRRIANLETVFQALSVPRSPFIENVNLKTFKTERAARASDAASKMLGHAYSRAVSDGMRARVLRVFLSATSNMEKIYESENALRLSGLSATIRDFLYGGGRIEEKLLEENLDAIHLPGRFLPVLFGRICRIADGSPGMNGKESLGDAHLFAESILRCLVRNPDAASQADMKTVVEQCRVEKLDATDSRTGWSVVSKMFSEEFDKENHPLLELFADTMKREPNRSFASSVFSMVDALLRESTPPSGFFKPLLDAALESSHQGTTTAVLSKKQAGPEDFGTYPFGVSHADVERLVVDALVRLPFESAAWTLTASYFKIPLHIRTFVSRKGPNTTDLLDEYFDTRAAPALERLALSALESGQEESFETTARIFEASGTHAFSKSGVQLLKTVAEAVSRADAGLGLNGRGVLSFVKAMSAVVFDTSKNEEMFKDFIFSGRVLASLTERVFESEKKDDGGKGVLSNTVNILSTTWANYLLKVPEKGKPNSQKERSADAARNSVSNIFLAVGKYIASALASSSDFSPELLACAEDAVEWRHEEGATMVATEILAASSRMEKSFKTLFREDGVRVEASLKNAVESALSVNAPRGGKTFVALCDASRNASLLAEERNETLPPLACSRLARFINDETGCMSLLGHMSRNFSSGKRPFDPRTGEGKETRENVFSMLLKASEHASDEFAASVVAFLESNMGKAFFTRKKTPREMPDNEKAFFEKLAVLAAAYIEDEDGDPEVVL